KMILIVRRVSVSLLHMKRTREEHAHLLRGLPDLSDILRGSLLERTIRHRQGCSKCERGEGHPMSVLAVTYPGGRTRQISLRPEQVADVRRQLDNYQRLKQTVEQISEFNQQALRAETAKTRSGRRA
ncbi:MAG: DUF6788 family protein, partial [Candidatus Sulfotelmatobacter sp.]